LWLWLLSFSIPVLTGCAVFYYFCIIVPTEAQREKHEKQQAVEQMWLGDERAEEIASKDSATKKVRIKSNRTAKKRHKIFQLRNSVNSRIKKVEKGIKIVQILNSVNARLEKVELDLSERGASMVPQYILTKILKFLPPWDYATKDGEEVYSERLEYGFYWLCSSWRKRSLQTVWDIRDRLIFSDIEHLYDEELRELKLDMLRLKFAILEVIQEKPPVAVWPKPIWDLSVEKEALPERDLSATVSDGPPIIKAMSDSETFHDIFADDASQRSEIKHTADTDSYVPSPSPDPIFMQPKPVYFQREPTPPFENPSFISLVEIQKKEIVEDAPEAIPDESDEETESEELTDFKTKFEMKRQQRPNSRAKLKNLRARLHGMKSNMDSRTSRYGVGI